MGTKNLTPKEKQSIKVLNFMAKFDGIIHSESDIKFMLRMGIDDFISEKRRHLLTIMEEEYPIRIKYSIRKNG